MMDSGAEIAFPLLFLLLFGVLGIASVVVWIWSLIHCVKNQQLSENNRLIGILLIVLLGLIGSLVYLFLPRDQVPPGTGT